MDTGRLWESALDEGLGVQLPAGAVQDGHASNWLPAVTQVAVDSLFKPGSG